MRLIPRWWPWRREPAAAHGGKWPDAELAGRHLQVEAGGVDGECAESTASSEHHQWRLPVEEPVHVEDSGDEASAASVHAHEVAGSGSEGSNCGESDGETVEGGAGGRRRGRRRERGGFPVFMVVGPAAALLLALVALVAWKRQQRRRLAG
ncbi:uncharacterized protein LOC133900033 [Phragmites australis]|uniref:uncharacterized protein LOC133900033 n=1 Tax=Phragmites australis TaxID=29695 RepID=UPI002D790F47|nr:uncharacterized protein LOC133900033 [Phragmites australis]